MSLGSPLGLHFDSSVSTHVDHPYNVEKLIGWWDFTDNNVVFTGDVGSLSVASFGDPIKQITNKANSGTDNLGKFLRTSGSSNAANSSSLYGIASINGNPFRFCSRDDNSSTNDLPFVASRVDGFGGVVNGNELGTSGTFSTSIINNHDLSVFFVIDSLYTDVVGSSQGDHFMGIGAKLSGFSDDGPPYEPGFRLTANTGGDDWQWRSPSLDSSSLLEVTNLDSNIQLTTSLEALSIINSSGTNGVKMYRNFNTSDGASTTITNSGADEGTNFQMDDGWFSLGGYSLNKFHNGVYAEKLVNVKIFEVLIYNKALTDYEKSIIENYIGSKYNIN